MLIQVWRWDNLFPAAGVGFASSSNSGSAGPKINIANHGLSIQSASEHNDIS
jgi:hypothetical protein